MTLPFETLSEMLHQRAITHPDQTFTFLQDGESDSVELRFASLERQARVIAAHLQALQLEGERALLMFHPGIDFVPAFYGCLLAGTIAVPVYPPSRMGLDRSLPRLQSIARDAGARAVLTTTSLLSVADDFKTQAPDLESMHWVATETLDRETADDWRQPKQTADSVAYLQYTSGSTGEPKGVVLTHGTTLACLHLGRHLGLDTDCRTVGWVPVSHDLGLITQILGPVFSGYQSVMMSPLSFLRHPSRWLRAISRYRATHTFAPNFGYELAARSTPSEEISTLDLSSWRVAAVGAEPVRATTLDAFSRRFASAGFRRSAFTPSFGLAEAVLGVTYQKPADQIARELKVDASALKQREVRVTAGDGVTLMSCGRPVDDTRVVVVDPETRDPLPADRIGEIWFQGPNVASGYWQRPQYESTFRATLSNGDEGIFLRTGDLGFLHEGELYVSSRLKDVIILQGANFYPHDIEVTVERSHPAIRPTCSAAFSVEDGSREQLVVVAEVDARRGPYDAAEVVTGIRRAVVDDYAIEAGTVVLLPPGGLRKTASGKVQRSACRDAFLSGAFKEVHRWAGETPTTTAAAIDQVLVTLRQQIADVLKVSLETLDENTSLTRLGMDSLAAVSLRSRVEHSLGVTLPETFFWQHETLGALSKALRALQNGSAAKTAVNDSIPITPVPRSGEGPLSFSEGALLRLIEQNPTRPSHNLFLAVQLTGDLDAASLEKAFQSVISRQESLRTRFVRIGEKARRFVDATVEWSLGQLDVSDQHPDTQEATLRRRAFDLQYRVIDPAKAPLMVAEVVRTGPQDAVLMLLLSHLVSDGWSFGVLMRELALFYAAHRRGTPTGLPLLPLQSLDYATWEQGLLTGETLQKTMKEAERELVPLKLPLDRPRPEKMADECSRVTFLLGGELRAEVERICRREGVPLVTALITAFQYALREQTGQDTISFSLAHSDRQKAHIQEVIGFFAYGFIYQQEVASLANEPLTLLRRNHERLTSTRFEDRLWIVLRSTSNRVLFNFHNYPLQFEMDDLQASHRPDLARNIRNWEAHDIVVDLIDLRHDLLTRFWYAPEVLDEQSVVTLTERFQRALHQLVSTEVNPS